VKYKLQVEKTVPPSKVHDWRTTQELEFNADSKSLVRDLHMAMSPLVRWEFRFAESHQRNYPLRHRSAAHKQGRNTPREVASHGLVHQESRRQS
jgi:hypothetical protein